ncbi:hypothetical protein P43SY_003002 [Pythium insidiosum]|uniref:C3H1-type domain-containing protein n=1 Tax=Pythium insidiosum TaxID=114742 RepID=A0AAD5Q4P2_PYTIN|nr:hypothetical protein P43SY_003002 [Pythium insidiosum]
MSSLVLGSAMDDKTSMCLSPQDKLKSSAKVSLVQLKKASTAAAHVALMPAHVLAMDVELADGPLDLQDMDLDLDLLGDDDDDADMDAGWISDDNLRALEFDERLNQDIDWVEHEDVDSSLKLEFVPDADNAQDFGFDPSSFLSPLRGGLTFEDSDVSSSFAESFSVDAPLAPTQDAEKLLMSFDTMHFNIPSPTSSSNKGERAGLFAKKDGEAKSAFKSMPALARPSLAMKGTMSPSLKQKASQVIALSAGADDVRKDDARAALPKLSIPTAEPMLGVLSISTPPSGTTIAQVSDVQKKIGSYSPNARRLRIQKFHEKRKNRTWKKSIKYDCRKKLADDRPRIKGSNMDPRVRDLYKRFLYVGRDYPLGLAYVREKAKAAFFKNKDLRDPVDIKKAVKKGRWMVRELIGVIQLKKYRTLNSRYTAEELQDALRNLECRFFQTPRGCLRGDSCSYVHEGSSGAGASASGNAGAGATAAAAAASGPVNDGMMRMDSYSLSNPYVHNDSSAVVPCRFFLTEAGCRNGHACPFSHVGAEDAAAFAPPPMPMPPMGFQQGAMMHHQFPPPMLHPQSPPPLPPHHGHVEGIDGYGSQGGITSISPTMATTPTAQHDNDTSASSKPRRKLNIQPNPSKKANYEVISEIMPVLTREIEGPFFAIDVECVATGTGVDDRDVARIAVVNEDEDVFYDRYVKPDKAIVSYLTQLTELRQILPRESVIVGQSIKKDLEWLGLQKGDDYKQMFDVADLFRIPMQSKNGTIRYRNFSLRHVAKYLLGHDIQEADHDPVIDAKYAMKIFKQFRHLHENPGRRDAVYQTLLQTPRTPSFAERYPVIDGVLMRIPRKPRPSNGHYNDRAVASQPIDPALM